MNDYGYAIADLPKAKVFATNTNGDGAASSPNSSGDTIALKPQEAPVPFESAATATSLTVDWNTLTTNAQTGGLPITSYQLDYDQGTNTWTDLIGLSSDSTATSHTVNSLTAGTPYKFRVRAKNAINFGDYSAEVTLTPSAKPSTMTAPVITLDEPYAKISWSAATNNGADITAYTITIMQSDDTTFTEETTYCDGSDSVIAG